MKSYILKILLFFAIVAGMDVCIGRLGDYLQSHAKSGNAKRINDIVAKDCHDIVILGSSRAHHTYDAPYLSDTLGVDVYNAGYDGNGVVLAYGLLSMILERYDPALVVYDVEPAFDINVYEPDNNNKRYINALKPYYWDVNVARIIKDVSTEEWCKVHVGLMRYNSSLISMAVDNVKSKGKDLKGYEPLDGIYVKETNKKEDEERTLDSFKLAYVEKLILLAQSKQIPIVFIASPKYGMISSESLEPIKDICTKTCVPFLDYYADTAFVQHKELFKEPMHLNKDGARLFSERIIKEITMYISGV